MNDESQDVVYVAEPRSRFPWGCLLGGCLTVVVLFVGGIAAIGLTGYWVYKGQITKYTSDTPRELPQVEMTAEEVAEIEQRVEAFQEELEQGETPDQLVLTADDINALISNHDELRGKVFVQIEEGQISAEVSIPTDAIPGGSGRFFNGSVTANVELANGVLIVTVSSAEVNGRAVPEAIMAGLKQENLAKDVYKDPEVARTLSKFESLVVEQDRIILTPKPQTTSTADDNGSDATDESSAAEPPAASAEVDPPIASPAN